VKIVLNRKTEASDTDPLLVQYLEGEEGRQTKKTIKVAIGDVLDLDDDLAIEIMNKHRGLFTIAGQSEGGPHLSSKVAAYAHKGKPGYDAKVPTAEG